MKTLLAPEVAFHLKAIRASCAELEVAPLEVFGSASVGPLDPLDSDANFLVTFVDEDERRRFDHLAQLMAFEDRLAEILDRPVDVSSATTFRNPVVARTVNRSHRLTYGTDPAHPAIPEDIAMTVPTHERTLKLLKDIRSTARALVEESASQTFEDLLRDLRFPLFVERSCENVGEAVRRLRDEDPATFAPLAEGDNVVGTRNVIVHGYGEIKYDRLWVSIKGPVPQLLTEVENLMRELGG